MSDIELLLKSFNSATTDILQYDVNKTDVLNRNTSNYYTGLDPLNIVKTIQLDIIEIVNIYKNHIMDDLIFEKIKSDVDEYLLYLQSLKYIQKYMIYINYNNYRYYLIIKIKREDDVNIDNIVVPFI